MIELVPFFYHDFIDFIFQEILTDVNIFLLLNFVVIKFVTIRVFLQVLKAIFNYKRSLFYCLKWHLLHMAQVLFFLQKNSWFSKELKKLADAATFAPTKLLILVTVKSRAVDKSTIQFLTVSQCSSYYIIERHGSKAKMVLSLLIPLILLLVCPF